MKKLQFAVLGACLLIATSCNKTSLEQAGESPVVDNMRRTCAAQDVLEEQMAADPQLRARMEGIEAFTRNYLKNNPTANSLVNGNIVIPVVVNVVYKTTAENISDAQVQSQIAVLNRDFGASNPDYNNTPVAFQSARSGAFGVQFVLDKIVRVKTKKTSFSSNDGVKKASGGGVAPTSPTTKLNMWSCNLGNGLLGYAQFPGGSAATDGVVILYKSFGVTSGAYGLGRTATHEVGHWMNLRHIWGDDGTGCTGSDLVNDTPSSAGSNYGCPTFPHVTCSNGPNGDMFMNYMDYE